jgi:periplasmic protein TonB
MAHARFETLLSDPEALAERRQRLMMGGLMAATLSMAMGLTSWTADKLGISAVTPPKHTYAVTLQLQEPPPPPPAPPSLPAAAKAEDSTRAAAPDEPAPPEPDEAPIEVVRIDLDARPQARVAVPSTGGGQAGGGGVPGPPGGGSRCLLPPCLGTQQVIGRPTVQHPPPPVVPAVQAPIKAVMATSVFTPDPDQARLSRTPTGRTHRRPGKTTVSFCIDGRGKTYDIRTRRGFAGDAEIDEICRSTVAKWRFSPQRVGGKVRSTCTAVTFDIEFE